MILNCQRSTKNILNSCLYPLNVSPFRSQTYMHNSPTQSQKGVSDRSICSAKKCFEHRQCFGQRSSNTLFSKADIVPSLMIIQVSEEDKQHAKKENYHGL